MFGNLTRREENPIQDVLVVISSNGTADIAPVLEIDDERLLARGETDYAVPLGDVKTYIGRRGRIFHYPAIEENVTDCKRLAALEKSIVLQKITMFEKEPLASDGMKLPLGKMLILVAIIVIIIIVLAVKH